MTHRPELPSGSKIDVSPGVRSQPRSPVLRSIQDLDEPLVLSETCCTLANARVVWANYDLIQRDFANIDFAASLPRYVNLPHDPNALSSDRPDIDAWLLHYAAVMSEAQLHYADTNEQIPVFGPTRVAYRPPRYGRALVVQLRDTWPNCAYLDPNHRPQGLLDVKGCGVVAGQVPSLELHRSGLLGLPVALGELVTQLIIERIFEWLQVDVRGVGIYAILDLGFRMKIGSLIPAGAIVRRAHQRPAGNLERPDYGTEQHRIKLAIEFMLRRFGVTSCAPVTRFRIWREGDDLRSSGCPYAGALDKIPSAALERFLARMSLQAPVEFDMINVQVVRGATLAPLSAVLVDFGQYDYADKRFVKPLACFVQNRPLHWGGFIDINSRYWIQPNPDISVDETLAGWVPTPSWIFKWAGVTSPAQTTDLFLFAAELVRDMTLRGLTRRELEKRICKFVETATRKLDQAQNMAEVKGLDWRTVSPNPESVHGAMHAGVLDALAHVEGFLAQNALRWRCRSVSGSSNAFQT
jgi:hypothetical protein